MEVYWQLGDSRPLDRDKFPEIHDYSDENYTVFAIHFRFYAFDVMLSLTLCRSMMIKCHKRCALPILIIFSFNSTLFAYTIDFYKLRSVQKFKTHYISYWKWFHFFPTDGIQSNHLTYGWIIFDLYSQSIYPIKRAILFNNNLVIICHHKAKHSIHLML